MKHSLLSRAYFSATIVLFLVSITAIFQPGVWADTVRKATKHTHREPASIQYNDPNAMALKRFQIHNPLGSIADETKAPSQAHFFLLDKPTYSESSLNMFGVSDPALTYKSSAVSTPSEADLLRFPTGSF